MKKGDYQSLKKATAYHSKRFAGGLKIVHEDEVRILRSWIKKNFRQEAATFLDVGAGTGRITRELFDLSPKKVISLDTSLYMLSVLKSTLTASQRKKLQTIKAKSDKIPLENNTVNLVTCFHLFKHLPDTNPTLSEFARVLKPRAYCIFDFLNTNSVVRFRLGTCYSESLSSMTSKLKKLNLKVLDSESLHMFGESVYNLESSTAEIFQKIDKLAKPLGAGTKIMLIAQKIA